MLTAPKDPAANRRFRARLLRRAARYPSLQKYLTERCKADPVWFCDVFAWQYNPRVRGAVVGPFVTWDFQEPALRRIAAKIDADRDLVIEKSREVGGTWLVLVEYARRVSVLPWQIFLLISHTEKAVSAPGDRNTLFAKIQFLVGHLPAWLVGDVITRKESFEFPKTKSNITGAATTQKAGVGGRCTDVLLDEFGLQQDDHEIWAATADLGARTVCSTHYGLGKKFYQLCATAREDRRDILSIHWSQHPLKKRGLYKSDPSLPGGYLVLDTDYDFPPGYEFVTSGRPTGGLRPGIRSPWYDDEVRRRGSLRDVALHLDVDVHGSTSQAADPELIERLVREDCRPPLWVGELDYDPSGRPVRLTRRADGRLRLWINPTHDGQVPFGRYAFALDVANGRGATPTCMSGGDVETGEKVLEFRDPWVKPDEAATLAVSVCWLFRTPGGEGARLGWECPGPGMDFGEKVLQLGYGNVQRHVTEGRPHAMVPADGKPGIYMNPNLKARLFREYLSMLAGRLIVNRSEPALREVLSYAYTPKTGILEHGQIDSKDDPSGARVNHGDLAVADMILAYLLRNLGLGKPDAPKPIPSGPPPMSLGYRMRQQRELERSLEE